MLIVHHIWVKLDPTWREFNRHTNDSTYPGKTGFNSTLLGDCLSDMLIVQHIWVKLDPTRMRLN